MLARANRLTHGTDYRQVVRRGARCSARHSVTYVARRASSDTPRFGFIVSKAVGNAVHRNRVRRRLKACCAELLEVSGGRDIVIRALPASAEVDWDTLRREIFDSVTKGISR